MKNKKNKKFIVENIILILTFWITK